MRNALTFHAPSRGITLVELTIVMVISAIILVPFALFFVQMVTMSRIATEKMLLAGDQYVAITAIRHELILASSATVSNDVISYDTRDSIGNPISRTLQLVGTDLTVTDTAGARSMMNDVAGFSATLVQPWQIEVTITVRSSADQAMGVTLTIQVMLLNASIAR